MSLRLRFIQSEYLMVFLIVLEHSECCLEWQREGQLGFSMADMGLHATVEMNWGNKYDDLLTTFLFICYIIQE